MVESRVAWWELMKVVLSAGEWVYSMEVKTEAWMVVLKVLK